MKTFALRKKTNTEQLRYRAGWSSPLSFDVYIQYMLSCFFLVLSRQNMLKILMFIYSFFVVSISDTGIFIDRLFKLENIVSFSDRRTWHVPLNL